MVVKTMNGSAYGSAVFDHSAESVWAEIRDFNSYPVYINGVTESHLEDDKRGDEVGCVRRFVYNGKSIRQTLTGHCDEERCCRWRLRTASNWRRGRFWAKRRDGS